MDLFCPLAKGDDNFSLPTITLDEFQAQHNLYATVSKQLENLKQEKQYYKNQLEDSRRCRAEEYNDFRYELKSLEKENKRLGFEINKVNEILRSMSKESQIEFFKAKKEIEKENIEIEKEKNKSYEMRL